MDSEENHADNVSLTSEFETKRRFYFSVGLNCVKKTKQVLQFESTFAESELTDAVLLVEGSKKIHVNKAILSYHSEFFRALFSSDFKEKSMEEIPIENVKYEHIAALLSLITVPVKPNANNIVRILELADRFLMREVPKLVEFYTRTMKDIKIETALMLASVYKMEETEKECLEMFTSMNLVKILGKTPEFEKLTGNTKIELLSITLKT